MDTLRSLNTRKIKAAMLVVLFMCFRVALEWNRLLVYRTVRHYFSEKLKYLQFSLSFNGTCVLFWTALVCLCTETQLYRETVHYAFTHSGTSDILWSRGGIAAFVSLIYQLINWFIYLIYFNKSTTLDSEIHKGSKVVSCVSADVLITQCMNERMNVFMN